MFNKIALLCLLSISVSANAQKLLVYKDACDDNRFAWPIKKTGAVTDSLFYYLENGGFIVDNRRHKGAGFSWVKRSVGANSKAYTSIQADLTQLAGEDNRGYGLMFNAKDVNNYVYIVITSTGSYGIAAIKDGKVNGTTVAWTKSSLIKTGLNVTNNLKVELRGDNYSFYINDVMVKKIDFIGQPFDASFGQYVAGSLRSKIDNIEIYQWLPESALAGKVGPGFVSTINMPIAAKPTPTKEGKQDFYTIKSGTKSQYGLKDKDGYRLLDPLYPYVYSNPSDGFVYIDREAQNARGVFSQQLEPIIPTLLASSGIIYKFSKDGYLSCKMPNGFWGVIDKTGNTILPFIYQQLDDVSEGLVFAKNGGLWGAIDLMGDTVLQFGLIDDAGTEGLFGRDKKAFRNGLVIARAKPGDGAGDGLMNKKGEWVVLPKYSAIHYNEEAKVYITENEDPDNDKRFLFALFDEAGKSIPLPAYNSIYPAGQNYIVAKGDCDAFGLVDNGANSAPCKFGLVDKTGKVIIPLNYSNIFGTTNKEILEVELKEKVAGTTKPKIKIGFYNSKGKELVPIKYDYVPYDSTRKAYFNDFARTYVSKVSDGIINVSKDGKFGAIDLTGKVIIPLQYDFLSSFEEGIAFAKKGIETYYIDKTGKKAKTPTNIGGLYTPVTELPPIRK
jgi:hypothetical protein